MANQRLTDKVLLTDPVDADVIHVVDVSDTTDDPEGTSKQTTWSILKDQLFSFLKLKDVNDSTYVGKTGFVPAVTYNSLGVPELKLTTLPSYTDLLGGNSIIRGGVIYSGSGLNYTIYASKYIINNQVYTDYVSDTVTLSDGDATNSRIDLFAVEITTDDPPVASIVVVPGTPAVSPVKPSLNLSTQVEVSFKLVLDNETTDPDFTAELIYNENLGETNEWDNILLATSGNLNYTTAPYNGTYSLYLPGTTSGTTKWQKDAMFAHDAEGSLNFAMKFPEAVETNPKIELELINSSDSSYFRFVLTVETLRDYGFDVTSNAWQLIRVPLNEFVSNSRFPPTEYDILSIKTVNSPIIILDVINIIGGVANPTNAQSVLEVVAGTNVTVDSSDPLRPIVSSTSTGLEQVTESAKTGLRRVGADPANYGDTGQDAVDLSISTSASSVNGARGLRSTIGGGSDNQVSSTWGTIGGGGNNSAGQASTVGGGINNTATGQSATIAGGSENIATNTYTTVSGGFANEALGVSSSVIGGATMMARSLGEVVGGYYGTNPSGDLSSWVATDRIFSIGNGTGTGTPGDGTYEMDAIVILKNGLGTLPEVTTALIEAEPTGKAIVTKEYGDANYKDVGYTVAGLPSGTVGDRAYVTDATAPTYNGTLTGGGAITVPVFYNGSAWVSA